MIEAAINRNIALKILNPSAKDLEHGLELHKNSFVFDAYGFMPLSGGTPERKKELIDAGASRDEIQFASEMYRMTEAFQDPQIRKLLAEAWEFSGVDCIFQNCGEESNDVERLLKRLGNYTRTIDYCDDIYERCVYPEKLEGIRARGKKALYITTNGVPVSSKFISAEENLHLVQSFFNLGVRMMHLTYNRRNLMGDGCAETANAGLSDFGRMAIAEMNRVGVIPDVAHSGQRTSLEAAQCSAKPVVASHSAVGKISTHYRAKCDEVIEAIKKTNGYIGICCYPSFLQGRKNINGFLDHIDYVVQKFGIDHVAIGTDRVAVLSRSGSSYPQPKSRPIWEQYWTGDGVGRNEPEDFGSLAWTNWPLFTVGLVMRGYSDSDIQKIIGGNVLRVCKDSMP